MQSREKNNSYETSVKFGVTNYPTSFMKIEFPEENDRKSELLPSIIFVLTLALGYALIIYGVIGLLSILISK
jgi:hypothetical protein